MKVNKLDNMIKGWFVGNFKPTLLQTDHIEVAVKEYKRDDYEEKHYHRVATEITVIVSGKVKMNNIIYHKGDIITIEPNEATDFKALEDTICTVVKYPSVSHDKYLGEVK